jgi:hypothetical protein
MHQATCQSQHIQHQCPVCRFVAPISSTTDSLKCRVCGHYWSVVV